MILTLCLFIENDIKGNYYKGRQKMTKQEYQRKVDSMIGCACGLLESYNLPISAIKAIRKTLFELLDKNFMEVVDHD